LTFSRSFFSSTTSVFPPTFKLGNKNSPNLGEFLVRTKEVSKNGIPSFLSPDLMRVTEFPFLTWFLT
jgi:hypothetical protein